MHGCEDVTQLIILKSLIIVGILLEYWLGKTEKIKSNSAFELLVNLVSAVITYLKLGPTQQRLERSKEELGKAMDNTQKLGINELTNIIEFGFELEKAGVDLFQGGSFHMEKLGELLPVYQKAIPAFANIGEVIPQLQDLDETEGAQLVALIVGKGVLAEDAAIKIEQSLKFALAGYNLFKMFQK